MKNKLFLISFSLLLLIGLLSATFNKSNGNAIFTFVNDAPNLPETPYEYSDITFPTHTFTFNDTIEVGYQSHTDTTVLDFVDDDISTLGRVLFYDEKLSAMENMSCATCHKQELSFADDAQFSQGISSLTTRNSMALNDLSWEGKNGFFWDMEFAALEDMIDIPFKDENEIGAEIDEVVLKMNATDYYPELFTKAFGDSEITEDRIVDALTNFIGSMVTFNSRFDQQADLGFQDFTDAEMAGLELFTFNCATCHSGGFFQEFEGVPHDEVIQIFPFIFNNGLEEVFTDIGAGEWLGEGYEGLYKITSLRNIELTAPYMHDGSLETLDDVIDFYSDDVKSNEWTDFMIPPGGFNFTDTEKANLKAFLLTLTDESFKTNVIWSDPFSPIDNVTEFETIDVTLAPNPMASYTKISVDNPQQEHVSLVITDQMGRQVFTDKFTGTSYEFNNYALPAGIYNVLLSTSKGKNTMQLIIQ